MDRDDKVKLLHQQHRSDVQIAQEIGMSVSSVSLSRRRQGLPPNICQPVDRVRLRELWELGWDDTHIATELGCAQSTVSNIRRDDLHLRCNRPRSERDEGYKFTTKMGKPMEECLSPGDCARMRRFLRDLINCANQKRPGDRYDVSGFMKEYIRSGVGDIG